MERALKFLTEAGTFYFGTDNAGQPEVRPFGFVMAFEGKLYFGMGKHKNVYKQLLANPKFVVCTTKENDWIRMRATAGLEAPKAAYDNAFATAPFLSTIYNAQSGLEFALVEAKNATVELCGMMGPTETYNL